MKSGRIRFKILSLGILLILLSACSNNSTSDLMAADGAIRLKWNKSYPEDSVDKSLLGLEWTYSFLGAMLPNSPSAMLLSANEVIVYPDELGLSAVGLQNLKKLHEIIRSSDEYQQNGNIDMGRYVTLLIGAPEHYYKIAGVPNHLDDLLANYELSADKGYVDNSEISLVHRIIRFSEQQDGKQVFVTSEVDSITGEIYEYETVEIMDNAQIRFGVFDANGNRKNSADASHTAAGKPANCMWCHESGIQQMFTAQSDFPGFLNYLQLQEKLISSNQNLEAVQSAMAHGVDFSQTQQHTLTELLYISFMEPSAERLSFEWNMPVAQIQFLLSGLDTHIYEEFDFLGNLYHRNQVEAFAPFHGLPVSTSVRQHSAVEVNYLND